MNNDILFEKSASIQSRTSPPDLWYGVSPKNEQFDQKIATPYLQSTKALAPPVPSKQACQFQGGAHARLRPCFFQDAHLLLVNSTTAPSKKTHTNLRLPTI